MGNSPNWTYGYVPTPAQWNNEFAKKQDDLGYTPVNRAGDTMEGPLSTFASIPERAGFTIQPGVPPESPRDGNVWFTSTGIYARVGGVTVGPISSGTVTSVGLVAPSQFTITNSPITGSGDIDLHWNDQAANRVLAGPSSGADASPSFRILQGDDLPNPTTGSKGGVKAKAAATNQFLTSIGTDGTPTSSQPSFTNISGQATSSQIATGVAAANLGFTPLNPANNLSDVANPATAATNIGAVSVSTVNTFTKTQIWSKGANVASAATLILGNDGNYFDVTGTVSITAIGTVGASAWIKLHFNAALTLTHHATNLVLPGGRNITTAAGDEAEFVEYAAGMWRCTKYQYSAFMSSGGVVASGSNANGAFTRYADGTQLCYFTGFAQACTVSNNPIFMSNTDTWTYPASFTGTPAVFASSSLAVRWAAVTPSGTSADVRQFQTISSATTSSVNLFAMGRWF